MMSQRIQKLLKIFIKKRIVLRGCKCATQIEIVHELNENEQSDEEKCVSSLVSSVGLFGKIRLDRLFVVLVGKENCTAASHFPTAGDSLENHALALVVHVVQIQRMIAFEGIEMPPIKLLASLVDSYEKLWKLNVTRDEDRYARAFGINQKNGERKRDWMGSLLSRNEQDSTPSCLCEQRRPVMHAPDIDLNDEQYVPEMDTLSEDHNHPCKVEEMEYFVKQLFEA
ncbi:hypothetical protein Tsp_11380 [Trichinella spiralis]|nr:hypothetical protein Tsp_11380 [Trichinella spiralis]